jgi:hypothetical protein
MKLRNADWLLKNDQKHCQSRACHHALSLLILAPATDLDGECAFIRLFASGRALIDDGGKMMAELPQKGVLGQADCAAITLIRSSPNTFHGCSGDTDWFRPLPIHECARCPRPAFSNIEISSGWRRAHGRMHIRRSDLA